MLVGVDNLAARHDHLVEARHGRLPHVFDLGQLRQPLGELGADLGLVGVNAGAQQTGGSQRDQVMLCHGVPRWKGASQWLNGSRRVHSYQAIRR